MPINLVCDGLGHWSGQAEPSQPTHAPSAHGGAFRIGILDWPRGCYFAHNCLPAATDAVPLRVLSLSLACRTPLPAHRRSNRQLDRRHTCMRAGERYLASSSTVSVASIMFDGERDGSSARGEPRERPLLLAAHPGPACLRQALPGARTNESAQRTCRFEGRLQAAPSGATLPLVHASSAGNQLVWGFSASDVSVGVATTSGFHSA